MKMKMTMVVAIAAVMCTGMTYARGPHGGGFGGPRPVTGHHGGFRPAPIHHHHHGSVWGRGGSNFWPGFVGGVIGGALVDAVVSPAPVVVTPAPVVVTPTPVVTAPVVTTPVVTSPVVSTQNVWVEGRYVDQVQPNGTILRVWQPGHYETRQVVY